jgi:hypothetical protein
MNKKHIWISLISLAMLVLYACSTPAPTEAPEVVEEQPAAAESYPVENNTSTDGLSEESYPAALACNAVEKTPGGGFAMCAPVACDDLSASFPVSYGDKTEVAACSQDGIVGICTTDGIDKIYYEGDPASLESGCSLSSGEWRIP